MAGWKIYPITYVGEDKENWVREQLLLSDRDEKKPSVSLDLRDNYQSERDSDHDLAVCRNKPRQDEFVELGAIEY